MIKSNLILDHYKWRYKIKNPNNYFKAKWKKLSNLNLFKNKNYEFSILLTDNKKMKKLNLKYRKKNKITDILSFPNRFSLKNKIYIGDMALSFDIIKKRSEKSDFFFEFDKIWIHGYLHLIGYDHIKIEDFNKMSKKESLIINCLYKKN